MNIKEFLQDLHEGRELKIKYVVVVNGERIARFDSEDEAWDVAIGYQQGDDYYGYFPDVKVVKDYEYVDTYDDEVEEDYKTFTYDNDIKKLAYKLVSMARRDHKHISFKDAYDILDKSFNQERDNLEDFYKSLDFNYIRESKKTKKEDTKTNESLSQEIRQTYNRLSRINNIDFNDLVYGKDGFMASCYPEQNAKGEYFPDFNGDVIYSEKHFNELVDWAKKEKGIDIKTSEYDEFDESLNVKSPLDYIEDKFNDEGIKYELDWIDDGDYDVELTILDPNNVDRADDIICNEVGYAYEVVRDKYDNKKAFKVATYQDVIDRLNESSNENKTTETKSIANKIVKHLKDSKYLHFEEVEDYYDGRVRIRYDFNNDLVNQARDTMKEILQDTLIDIFIEDYDDIEVSILSTLGMSYDDWCGSLEYTDDEELYAYLDENLGDEALLDNAKNNNTWDESLKEDKNINQSNKGLNNSKKIVENKLQESRDFYNYKTQLEKAKTKDELTKIWDAFRKDYDSEMTPNEEKTLGELYKDLRKEITEDKQVTYVWKRDGDDHILTKKGNNKALITLSRMNNGFPWTIYKGNKEITLDTDSDKLSDIKAYILKNVDKILDNKLKEDKSVEDWLKPMFLCDTLEQQPFISFAYEDQDGSIIATTSWETTPRKAHKHYIDTCAMKVIKDNYNISVLRQENRDNNKEFAYVMRITPKNVDENLKEADDKYFSSKPTNDIKIKKFVKEYADEIKKDIDNETYDDYGMWSHYLDMFTIDFPKNRLTTSEFAIKFFNEINKRFGTDFHYGYIKEDLQEDTFNDKMDFLAKDEEEAIDGYKKVIKTIDNDNVKTQLKKIETEEKAHKDYLERVKKNKNIKYTEPLDEE